MLYQYNFVRRYVILPHICSVVHSNNFIAAVRNFCKMLWHVQSQFWEGRLRSVKANLMPVQGCRGIYFNFMARNGYYYYSLIFPGAGKAYLVSYFL